MRKVAVISTGLVASVALAIAAGIGMADAAAATPVQKVTVVAKEFKFTLSKRTVHTGVVVFTVKNEGKIRHDFRIDGHQTKLIAPGGSATLRIDFTKKGSFKYTCTVPGHATDGMRGELGVGQAPAPTPTTTTPTTPTGTTPVNVCPTGSTDQDGDGDQNLGGVDDGDGCE